VNTGLAAVGFTPGSDASVAAFLAIVIAVLVVVFAGVRSAARRAGEPVGRWTAVVAVVLAVWLAGTSVPVVAGALSGEPLPALPLYFGGLLAGATVFAFSPIGRLLARATPLGALVGFHAFRLPLELVLHAWAAHGTVPGTMTWTGQNVDIATGVLALVCAPFAARSRAVAWAFQLLGLALLVNVLRLVVLSSPPPLGQGVEPPLELVRHMPYALIASVCVAGAFAGHLVGLRALWTTRARVR
jgi:hypothetical protein